MKFYDSTRLTSSLTIYFEGEYKPEKNSTEVTCWVGRNSDNTGIDLRLDWEFGGQLNSVADHYNIIKDQIVTDVFDGAVQLKLDGSSERATEQVNKIKENLSAV